MGSAPSSDLNQPKPACTQNLANEVLKECEPTYGTEAYNIMLIKNYLLMMNAERQLLKGYQNTMSGVVDEILQTEKKNLSESDKIKAYRYCYTDDLLGMIDIINPMMEAYTTTLKNYAPDKELIKVPIKTIMHSEIKHLITPDEKNPDLDPDQSEQLVETYNEIKNPGNNITTMKHVMDERKIIKQGCCAHTQTVQAQLESLLRLLLTVGSGTSDFIGSDKKNRLTPNECLKWLTDLLCDTAENWTMPLMKDKTQIMMLRAVRTAIQNSIISEIQLQAIDFLDQREKQGKTSLSEEDAEKAARDIIEDYYKNDREESNKINQQKSILRNVTKESNKQITDDDKNPNE